MEQGALLVDFLALRMISESMRVRCEKVQKLILTDLGRK